MRKIVACANQSTLFVGGILDSRRMEVCPWQRVHYVLEDGKTIARYVRRHLAFDKGPAVRVFVLDRLDELSSVNVLIAAYHPSVRRLRRVPPAG